MLLVNPSYEWVFSSPPLGLSYLAGSLKSGNIPVLVIDCQVTPDYKRHILEALDRFDTIGISVNIGTISSALNIAEFVRKNSSKTRIIMGGPHATVIYKDLIPRYADIVVLGEGEIPILELARKTDLSQIKGIAYWDSQLRINVQRNIIQDLDTLHYPAWEFFDLKRYIPSIDSKSPALNMITSRGCVYECIFCSVESIYNKKINLRSIKNVLDELDYVVKDFKVREITIVDDNFTLYPERVREFCDGVISKGYKIRFMLMAAKADFCDREILRLMAKAGFFKICISVESGSQEILDKLNKKLDLSKVRDTVDAIRSSSIKCYAFFLWGLPYDDFDSMLHSIRYSKTINADRVIFFRTVPLPGTPLYDMVEKQGRFLSDVKFSSKQYLDDAALYEIFKLRSFDMMKIMKILKKEFNNETIKQFIMMTFSSDVFLMFNNILKCIGSYWHLRKNNKNAKRI